MSNIAPTFAYDAAAADVRVIGTATADSVTSRLFSYATPTGIRRVAELIRPELPGSYAAALFVHWYEPEAHDSNRTQFHSEAHTLARRGVVSLLIETMWSDRDWFLKRTQADDLGNSIRQVIELRQALDLLLAEPGVDPQRVAYVGHDFGAMYGVLLGTADPRATCYVLMAGTPRFPDWYLYYPRLADPERATFIAAMAPYDPIAHIAQLTPTPLLFQFGTADPHVPVPRAQEFYAAAQEPKQLAWYDAGHALNDAARAARLDWLAAQLQL